MTGIHVVPVRDRATQRAWLRLPGLLYRDDPAWTPPLRRDERADLRRPPTGTDLTAFLALDGDRPVGRLTCATHAGRPELHLAQYEAVDDDPVAEALFATAVAEARGRGHAVMVGPRSHFVIGSGVGLQISGFDRPAPAGISHHQPYYRRHWEDVGGFRPVSTLRSYAVARSEVAEPAWLAPVAARAEGYHSPRFDRIADLRAHGAELLAVLNTAMAELPDQLPFPLEDTERVLDRLAEVVDPRLIRLIFHDDELVGYIGLFPEVGAALRRSRGRLLPLGWWWITREQRRTRTVTLNGLGILPAHQSTGALAVGGLALVRTILDDPRWRNGELVLVDESNTRARSLVEDVIGAHLVGEHRVYERPVS